MKRSIVAFISIIFFLLSVPAILADINTGLVAHYNFNNDIFPSVSDSSGNGYTGHVNNVSTIQTVRYANFTPFLNKIYINSSSSNQTVIDVSNIADINGNWTISFWINFDSGQPDFYIVNSSYPVGTRIRVNPSGSLCFDNNDCVGQVNANSWSFVIAQRLTNSSGSFYRYLKNGTFSQTEIASTIGRNINGTNKTIGAQQSGSLGNYNFQLADVRFYDRTLSQSDASDLFDFELTAQSYYKTTLEGTCAVFPKLNDTSNFNQTLGCTTAPISTVGCSVVDNIQGRFFTGYELTNAQFQNILNAGTCSNYNITKKYVFNPSGYFVNPQLDMCTDIFFGYGMPTLEQFADYGLYQNNSNITATCSFPNTNLNVSVNTIACQIFADCRRLIGNSSSNICNNFCQNGNVYSAKFNVGTGNCENQTLVKSCTIGCGSATQCQEDIFLNTTNLNVTNPLGISTTFTTWFTSTEGIVILISAMVGAFVAYYVPSKEINHKLYGFGLTFLSIMTAGIFFKLASPWLIVFPILVLTVIARKFILHLFVSG